MLIYTDHKNILNVDNLSEQQLRWIPHVDEYGPTIHYIEGPHNVSADSFSRLSRKDVPSALVGKKATHVVSDSELESLYSSLIDNEEILQCFLNLLWKDLKCVVRRPSSSSSVVVVVRRRRRPSSSSVVRRPYLLSSHVTTLVTSQHFNV